MHVISKQINLTLLLGSIDYFQKLMYCLDLNQSSYSTVTTSLHESPLSNRINGFYFTYEAIIDKNFITIHIWIEFKGQLISKANCQAKDSSKKWTNEFLLVCDDFSFDFCDDFSIDFWKNPRPVIKRFEIIRPLRLN